MTVPFKERLKSLFSNDFFVAFLILLAYLCTNSYIYAWDDQHLEIPLLKHLIDPSLYKGDYYVEGLAKNFSSYFFPLLAKFTAIPQIPTVYFILFLVSRYIMFLFFYKLCQLISKDRFAALCATLAFFLTGRTEEFLYRTFSHQEFAEGLMFAGIYYFYKERYILAALIFGIAANFHAIYNLFPMCFMLFFLLLFHPKRISMIFKAGLTFTIACLPFLLWQIPRSIHDKLSGLPVPVEQWMQIYRLSCPQNFIFDGVPLGEVIRNKAFLASHLEPYAFVLLLYIFLLIVFPAFRKDKKTHAVVVMAWGFIIISNIFTYLIPSRFALDLNLLRNEQYIRLILMAYAAIWAVKTAKEAKPWKAFAASLAFLFIGFNGFLLFALKLQRDKWALAAMFLVFLLLQFKIWPRLEKHFRKALVLLPLLGSFVAFGIFHYNYLQMKEKGTGFWQLQRNWIDMQLYVRDHTPKDSLILAPINMDMGGFRIYSERKIVVCIRDCGIVGFDYKATLEWKKRMDDMKDFVVMTNKPVDQAVLMAILKYKVDYIVFMKYYEPQLDNPVFKKMYQNEAFGLYKVVLRPNIKI